MDNQLTQTTATPYFSTNSLGVGSHHVYAIVTDANNSTATTLTVAFEVLPNPSSSPQPSPSVPEFAVWTVVPLVVATTVGLLVYITRRKPALP